MRVTPQRPKAPTPPSANPWLGHDATQGPDLVPESRPGPDRGPSRSRRVPRFRPGSIGPGSDDGLATREVSDGNELPDWWWLGCHGGAGVSTLEAVLRRGEDAGRAWPIAAHGGVGRVVLVARTHVSGLLAVQAAARQWAAGGVPRTRLLGAVLLADAPGKLPNRTRNLVELLSGALPRLWLVPWMDPLRLTARPNWPTPPAPFARIGTDLAEVRRQDPE